MATTQASKKTFALSPEAPKKPLSAKARTLSIPGVDVREQNDRAALPAEPGPSIEQVWSEQPLKTAHLAFVAAPISLCGARLDRRETGGAKHVCQACRVEASRLRAVLR